MVSSSSAQQVSNANALLVSNNQPLIFTSSASNTHLTPTSSGVSTISTNAATNPITQPNANQYLQFIQNQQQRSFLFSQPPAMFLPSQNQLLAARSNTSPHHSAVFVQNTNQQILLNNLNKNLLESQKGKQIIIPGHQNHANLQPRSQLLTAQPQIINPAQFLASPLHQQAAAIAWPPSSPIILRPQMTSDQQQLFLQHTLATANQTILGNPSLSIYQQSHPSLQNTSTQLMNRTPSPSITLSTEVKSTQNDKLEDTNDRCKIRSSKLSKLAKISASSLTRGKSNLVRMNENNSNGCSIKKTKNSDVSLRSPKKSSNLISSNKGKNSSRSKTKKIGDKMRINNVPIDEEQEESTSNSSSLNKTNKRSIVHKSTQQMNDELLAKKDLALAKQNATNEKKLVINGKKEKKNISIVKPRVLLTHKVSGYLIQESDKPFSVDDQKQNGDCKMNEIRNEVFEASLQEQNSELIASPTKLSKVKKSKKMKSTKSNQELTKKTTNEIVKSKPLIDSSKKASKIHDNNMKSIAISESHETTKSNGALNVDNENHYQNKLIFQWTVEEVHQFVLDTTSNKEFANALKQEEFNGSALTLLTIPILRNFELKLGPILLLIKKIDEFKSKENSQLTLSQQNEEIFACIPSHNANIYEWSVDDVHHFILKLTSKQAYANEFSRQEIDGHSLTLISEDNMRKDLNMAFGPSMLIIDRINKLKGQT